VSAEDLDLLNTRILLNQKDARNKVGQEALYLCPTKDMVKTINREALQHLIDSGAEYFRCVAVHKPTNTLSSPPTTKISQDLLKHYSDDLLPPFIDLAIGSRVRCTVNLATNIGIYDNPFSSCEIYTAKQEFTMVHWELLLRLDSEERPHHLFVHLLANV
jgi:hypothetical protein